MKQIHAIAVVVMAFALAGLAVVATAGARTSAAVTVGLTASPATVLPNAPTTLSVLLKDGAAPLAGGNILIDEYANSGCSTGASFLAFGATNAGGVFSATASFPTLGVHYVSALWLGGSVQSACVKVTVGVTAPATPTSSGPDRYAYCSVTGDTNPDGTLIPPNTFLNLLQGQPDTDSHYTGAKPAFWLDGVGLTCDVSPGQAASAASSSIMVNHVGLRTAEEGPLFYLLVPKG